MCLLLYLEHYVLKSNIIGNQHMTILVKVYHAHRHNTTILFLLLSAVRIWCWTAMHNRMCVHALPDLSELTVFQQGHSYLWEFAVLTLNLQNLQLGQYCSREDCKELRRLFPVFSHHTVHRIKKLLEPYVLDPADMFGAYFGLSVRTFLQHCSSQELLTSISSGQLLLGIWNSFDSDQKVYT